MKTRKQISERLIKLNTDIKDVPFGLSDIKTIGTRAAIAALEWVLQ